MSTIYNDFLANIYDFCPYFKHRKNTADYYLSALNNNNMAVLELGTATGSITIPLINAGYIVDTVDNSMDMQKVAKDKLMFYDKKISERINFIYNDITKFTPPKKYGSIIIPDSILTVILDENDRKKTLQMCYDSLVGGGVIVLDIYKPIEKIITQTRYTEKSRFRDKNKDIYIVTVNHNIEKDKQLHSCCYEYELWPSSIEGVKKTNIEIVYKYIYPNQIRELLENIGFRRIEIKEIFDGNVYFVTADK